MIFQVFDPLKLQMIFISSKRVHIKVHYVKINWNKTYNLIACCNLNVFITPSKLFASLTFGSQVFVSTQSNGYRFQYIAPFSLTLAN